MIVPQALILLCRQRLRLGFDLTLPPVFAITHEGTGFFSLPAFASLSFLAVGLFLAVFYTLLIL
jgi:hypothetical protein